MEYRDLSPYEYRGFPLPMLTIGWLGTEFGVPGADAPPLAEADRQILTAASRRLGSVTLGTHECEFCTEDPAFEGNGEYRYYLSNGDTFSAPAMMPHYLTEHGYRPPEIFLKGLRETGPLAWDARAERLREVLLDEDADFDFRCEAIVDLPNWQDPRAVEAVLFAAHDEELADVTGEEIGQSLVAVLGPELHPDEYSGTVRFGIDQALEK